ncbi:MAG TPA: hypothetical protein VKR61_12480 [Bryobacteraceae bacterium]|nr:hypothetical protein [Bryobacteraceae bacterium]
MSTPNEHQGVSNNGLLRAAASSPTDIWAVGQSAIHFDGTKWTAFPTPMIKGDNTSNLNGLVDFSPTDAWAAGIINIGLANPNQIIEHWDGTQWSVFPGPTFASNQQPSLYGMTATAPNNIWAVGAMLTNNQTLSALFEHYDGTAWTATEGRFFGFFNAVSADAPNDIWAVGCGNFSEHYDGTAWKLVRAPNVGTGKNCLNGVLALAPNDVWAVGYSTPTTTPPPGQFDVPTLTLTEHFDGTSWTVVPSPNIGPKSQYQSNRLLGVVAVSSTDVWAFGSYFAASGSNDQLTLVMHWDGTAWTIVPTPNPKPGGMPNDILFGGVVTAPSNVWLVGSESPFTQGKPVTVTLVLYNPAG